MSAAKKRARGRPAGGSDALVGAVLEATLEQLGEAGYDALSIEEVARASGVNKTSVYRRWETKSELVIAALKSRQREESPFVETGDLARDLAALLTRKARRISTPSGRLLARALMTVSGDPQMMASLRASRFGLSSELLRSAMKRGELPTTVDAELAAELLLAPIVNRIVVLDESASAAFIEHVVRLTLTGLGYQKRKKQR